MTVTIYELYDIRDSVPVYVGSTRGTLSNRLSQHWNTPSNKALRVWMRGVGRDNLGIRAVRVVSERDRLHYEFMYMNECTSQGYTLFNIVTYTPTVIIEGTQGSI